MNQCMEPGSGVDDGVDCVNDDDGAGWVSDEIDGVDGRGAVVDAWL